MARTTPRIMAYLTEDMHAEVKTLSAVMGVSLSDILVRATADYLPKAVKDLPDHQRRALEALRSGPTERA